MKMIDHIGTLPTTKKVMLFGLLGMGALVALIVAVAVFADPTDEETATVDADEPTTTTDATTTTEATTTTTTTEVFGLDYDLLSTQSQELTELQFDEWAKEFIGTEVGWYGQVERVEESLFENGRYEVRIDIDGGSGILERAVLVMTKDNALAIPKDADVFFTGTITKIDNLFALTIDIAYTTIEIR